MITDEAMLRPRAVKADALIESASVSPIGNKGKLHQATSGYLNDTQPVFDPEGKFLFYASHPGSYVAEAYPDALAGENAEPLRGLERRVAAFAIDTWGYHGWIDAGDGVKGRSATRVSNRCDSGTSTGGQRDVHDVMLPIQRND